MENARLITETREALEQQTATAEVLRVINSSPGDLAPVFDAMLEKAHTLCEAALGGLVVYDGEHFRAVADAGAAEVQFAELFGKPFRAEPGQLSGAIADGGQRLSHPRCGGARHGGRGRADKPETAAASSCRHTAPYFSCRCARTRPLLGYISAYRQEVRPFSDKQIALLQNFAAQAVIAMENARLITETREALGAADRDRRGTCRSSIPRPATLPRSSTLYWRRRTPCAVRRKARW